MFKPLNALETLRPLSAGMLAAFEAALPVPADADAVMVDFETLDVSWSWSGNEEDIDGFAIERQTNGGGAWTQITTVAASARTYEDDGLTPDTIYGYRIRAFVTGPPEEFSDYSNIGAAATGELQIPGAITATAQNYEDVGLVWADTSPYETGFEVEARTTPAGPWVQVCDMPPNSTSCTAEGLTPNTEYEFRVRAIYGTYQSAWSATDTATTHALPVPGSVGASAISHSAISVTWVDTASGESGFEVQYSLAGQGSWVQAVITPANVEQYTVGDLEAETEYDFRVRSIYGSNQSAWSNIATEETPIEPGDIDNAALLSTTNFQLFGDWFVTSISVMEARSYAVRSTPNEEGGYAYTHGAPWNTSNLTRATANNFLPPTGGDCQAIVWQPDGMKCWVLDRGQTPYPGTASNEHVLAEFTVTNPFTDDGRTLVRFYVIGTTSDIQQVNSLRLSHNGERLLWVADRTSAPSRIGYFNMPTPYSLPASGSAASRNITQIGATPRISGFGISQDQNKMYLIDRNNVLYQYSINDFGNRGQAPTFTHTATRDMTPFLFASNVETRIDSKPDGTRLYLAEKSTAMSLPRMLQFSM